MPETQLQDPTSATSSPPLSPRRKRRWPGILLWSAAALALLLASAAVLSVFWLRSAAIAALPALDGDLHLAGLSAPVIVRRDAHGVPHIEATNEDDLFIAQGYITAQDRLWQMDAARRAANGELAEVLGPSQIAHDKMQRVLQLRLVARRVYANLSAKDRARLDLYARGVNLFIDQHRDSLPPEFRLLFYHPRPWTGEDSLSVGMMMVQMLDTHWNVKLSRERIAAKLNDSKLEKDLYPVGSWRDHPPTGTVVDLSQPHPVAPATTDPDDEDDDRNQTRLAPMNLPRSTGIAKSRPALADSALQPQTGFTEGAGGFNPLKWGQRDAAFRPGIVPSRENPTVVSGEDLAQLRSLLGQPTCAGCAPGSNNWVISGKHTASGKPLLSNDMHLPLTEPDTWYMADLSAPGYHVAGVTLPGIPGVIAGHNEHVAWGFTALYADVQDLYIEKLDGKGNYEGNDAEWHPLAVDHETIKVRGAKDVLLDVQSTEHGPLLNPIFTKETRPIALKWTLYDPALNEMPIYELDTASNWEEFSAVLERWCWPTQNVVYADDQGHIAYHAIGRVPLRPGYGDVFGKPLDRFWGNGWMNGRAEWGGPIFNGKDNSPEYIYIPFDRMPSAFDPPSGFLATANSRVTANPPHPDPFPGNDPSLFPLTLEWVEPYRTERIYKLLDGRDHLTPADMLAVQTDVYSEVDQELGHRFAYAIDHTLGADDRLKKAADLMRSWDGKLTTDSAAASIVTQTRYALWPLILEPKLGKDLAAEYRWAESNFAEEEIVMHGSTDWLPLGYKNWDNLLTDAVRKGMERAKAPADPTQWRYGSWHVVDVENPVARLLPLIGRVAGTGELPLSGDTTTVKQVGRSFGPSQRFTMDWSGIDSSTENIVMGQSGNPFSPHFRDQWNDWYGGTTFAFPFTPAAVAAQTRHTLRLLP